MLNKMGYINKHGIFINYKRSHKDLAGRIYDYLTLRGLNPFMDEYSMNQGEDFRDTLEQEIIDSLFFLSILSEDGVKDLTAPDHEDKPFYKEVETACLHNKKILMIVVGGIDFYSIGELPKEIEKIKYINHYPLPKENRHFHSVIDNLLKNDILNEAVTDKKTLEEALNWRMYAKHRANTLLAPRTELESSIASLNNRFGVDFVECVRNKEPFTGDYRIKEINMTCYAASIVVAPDKNMNDRKAYDFGLMFNIFAYLLEDMDFSLRIITNAPCTPATEDAIEYAKTGNSALEDYEEAGFLGSYASINQLREKEPYKSAFTEKRFRFMVTDCSLPYSLFQIQYKNGWEEFDHIKVDLYSYGIDSNADRRSMVIFRKTDSANYDFFEKQIQYLKSKENRKRSDKLIRENHDKWIEKWNELKAQMEDDDW